MRKKAELIKKSDLNVIITPIGKKIKMEWSVFGAPNGYKYSMIFDSEADFFHYCEAFEIGKQNLIKRSNKA